jgi:hypothetical protein
MVWRLFCISVDQDASSTKLTLDILQTAALCSLLYAQETGMNKEIRTKCSEEHLAAIELAARKVGLTVSAFVRMAALTAAAKEGFHAEQPVVD